MRHLFGRLTAVLLAAVMCSAAARATMTVTVNHLSSLAVIGYPYNVIVTVHNSNGTDASISGATLNLGGGLAGTVNEPFQSSPNQGGGGTTGTIPAGGDATSMASVTPSNATGTGTLSASVTTQFGTATSAAVPVTVAGVNSGGFPNGSMQIRHNIVFITSNSNGGPTFNSPALIVLKGTPGGTVSLSIRAASGAAQGGAQPFSGGTGAQTIPEQVVLDAAGNGSYLWDRQAGTSLDTGIWWVIASGAVNDRKPVLILDHK